MAYIQTQGLTHGGCLNDAVIQFNIPLSHWLDLSTGINPNPWPVPLIPPRVWSRLPENNDGLELAASRYYGVANLLAVAGSQSAIQSIPRLFQASGLRVRRVGVLHPSYNEHAHAWRTAGHKVILLTAAEIDHEISDLDVLVLVNPNNPTGELFNKTQLLEWHNKLQFRNGTLIIDEAFMDALPHCSLIEASKLRGLIVLRSLGKFFGMAGIRLGFVFAENVVLQQLGKMLGPWPIATPSRWVATQALMDTDWQNKTCVHLAKTSKRLNTLLCDGGLMPTGGTHFFQWLVNEDAKGIYQKLAEQGILIRLFTQPRSLRFGMPGTEQEWTRLASAIQQLELK